MNKELKDKWVEALRSGKYKKGAGKLFDKESNTYCCLGVLGRVMKLRINGEGTQFTKCPNSNSMYPVLDEIIPNYVQGKLANLNDHKAKSFKAIANFIEKRL